MVKENNKSLQDIKEGKDEFEKDIPMFQKIYNNLRNEFMKKNSYPKIKNKKAILKGKIMNLRSSSDLDIKSIIHIDEMGEIYLLPAIKNKNKLYYVAEKEHIKLVDELINIHYFDKISEKGYMCHSLIPKSFKSNPLLDETIIEKAKELDADRKILEKEFVVKTVMDMSKEQQTVLKIAVVISLIGGFGVGCITGIGLVLMFII